MHRLSLRSRLKTGNPAVVNSSFLLFFPFTFLTTALVPEQALTPWFRTIAKLNPVTYILAGLRSLLIVGWAWGDIAQAFLAILIVAVVSITLAFRALNGRRQAEVRSVAESAAIDFATSANSRIVSSMICATGLTSSMRPMT